jgi:heme-degrading monooxygenase HmoA
MAIRHVVTIQVARGKAASFASAFKPLQVVTRQEEGCQRYELFQSLDDPDKMVMLERWPARSCSTAIWRRSAPITLRSLTPLALWAPGITPTVERFEV